MSKIISPNEYEKRIDDEARKQAKRVGLPFSSTGKTSKERYFFIQGVKDNVKKFNKVKKSVEVKKSKRAVSHRRSKPRRG